MGESERRRLAQHILADWPDLTEALIVAGEGQTAAQFQERCAQIAMSKFWESVAQLVGGERADLAKAEAKLEEEAEKRAEEAYLFGGHVPF
jgi:hypothetical protein